MPPTPLDIANQHLAARRFDQAEAALRRIVSKDPRDALAIGALGMVYFAREQFDQAEYHFKRALAINASRPELHQYYGYLLANTKRPAESKAAFQRAVEISPNNAAGWTGLSVAELTLNELTSAVEHARNALQLGGDRHDGIYTNAANAMNEAGLAEEALAILLSGAERFPHAPPVFDSMRLAMLHYPHDPSRLTGRFIQSEHARLGPRLAAGVSPLPPLPPFSAADRDRPLRIAYFSSDLRQHSVASFLLPILRHRDRAHFHVSLYQHGPHDSVSDTLRAHCEQWVDALGIDDEALAQRLRRDKIDLIVDLNGHTTGNRLRVLARKPVPIQATYLGYPNITGLPGMDFRIVDALSDPLGDDPPAGAETLVRLPRCFLCFEPHPDAPPCEREPSPADGSGIVFGSFNAIFKASAYVRSLWAKAVLAVPGSRLLLKNKALADAGVATRVRAEFAALGIDPSRLELLGAQTTIPEHLALYKRVDIALDTFPYHGTTTTCEALHMGVPVVTLAGDSHVSRVGVSLLHSVGLDDLVARDEGDFVRLAAQLANDRARLATLRSSLRATLLASPLGDAKDMAQALEAAYRKMWQNTCMRESASP